MSVDCMFFGRGKMPGGNNRTARDFWKYWEENTFVILMKNANIIWCRNAEFLHEDIFMHNSNFTILYGHRKLLDWKNWWLWEKQEGLNFTAGFAEGLEVWLGLSSRLKPVVWNHKSKLDLSTELSTEASTDLPSVLHQIERLEDLRMVQEVLKEPEDETSDENIELENDPEDEIKATFDRRLKILKRACSVLPQLRGANDLASHNQLIRKGWHRVGFFGPFADASNPL